MLNDFTGAEKVYIACGYTDLRRGIDGLAAMVQQEFPPRWWNTVWKEKIWYARLAGILFLKLGWKW